MALLSPVVSADPSFVQPRILLGLAYLGKYNTAEAIKQFEQVNQINPKIAEGHYYRARALLARGDVDGARKAYQRALDLAPDSKGVRIELAALSGQKPDDALLASQVVELKEGLDREPGNIAIRYALARAYLTRNQRKEGEAEYRRILEVAPTFVPANLALGVLRLQDGKPDEAADFLKAVVRAERGIDFEPLCNLAARAVTNACLTESRRNVTGSFCLWRDGRADSHLRKQPP